MRKPKQPTWIDAYVGKQLRRLRKEHDLSQSQLAHKIGVSFQQVQKYENGTNRVAVSTLYKICLALNCEPMNLLPDPSQHKGRSKPEARLAS